MDSSQLQQIISGCKSRDRKSQKDLYRQYFGFSIKICLRYAEHREEAVEIVNDGFMRVFTNIGKYDNTRPFNSWLSTIMINTSIDYYRKRIRRTKMEELNSSHELEEREHILSRINYDDLIKLVQKLSTTYRTVFNLFVIDGYTHEEIAAMLSISVGTSKSNLFKARHRLKEMLNAVDDDEAGTRMYKIS
ncbi:RNA polymerase sigma factor [Paradesertivirga mongoliensis]|uniref:RNA polymerase sigma factor n=1 Tax=Paradesertivirga mongoliensis TaxID=2100740 RepID=A0ABW4ZGS0_9SPHI|nr:sigma-70 family RNA polymerase sigma factor [Pedobacter mongoliensis]